MNLNSSVKSAFNDRFSNINLDMGMSQVSESLPSFFTANSKFESKSIQTNFRFIVDFDDVFDKELINQGIIIKPYHVLSIDMPTSYGFKYESMKIGPYSYSFPTMDHNGFDITIVFEEDRFSSIAKMIHVLQSKIIRDGNIANGNYNPQSMNRLSNITINIFDDAGAIVRTVRYWDVFFTGATPTALNYDGNESIKYTITFHCDFMEQEFTKLQ